MNAIIVHGGTDFPPYIAASVEQFFLFNAESNLYCIVDKPLPDFLALAEKHPRLKLVARKDLRQSASHGFYLLANRRAHNAWRGGFWRYVVERFFLIEEFMRQSGEQNLLHFEYDNLIYTRINDFERKLAAQGKILVPADGDTRCIAGVVFIPSAEKLREFCRFYNRRCTIRVKNDMFAFSDFLDAHGELCATLPVVPQSYTANKASLTSQKGETHYKLWRLSNLAQELGVLFDAAAYGQFVGGTDGRNAGQAGGSTIGFVNPDAAYNVQDFSVEWQSEGGLLRPFLRCKGAGNGGGGSEKTPLFNLHIHSKKLDLYKSDRENRDG